MSGFQIEFRQVVHRAAAYHPILLLFLMAVLSVLAVGLYSIRFQAAPMIDTVEPDLAKTREIGRSLDQLERYVRATRPMSDVAEVFGRVEPPPPVELPAEEALAVPVIKELVEIPELLLSAVYRSGGRPLAEINGKLYGCGDTVNGLCTLRTIENEQVVLDMEDGRVIHLVLYKEKQDESP